MTGQQRLLSAGAVDAARAAELRRVKALAALVLVACLVVLVIAKIMQPRHAAFGFLAAFAEAAAIGGLADWYAVVALFRRPLGLPIPHTAIIPANQQRIAEKLGEFVERHFLDAAPVEAKLRSIDFASFVADWLADQRRSAELARFVVKLLPDAVAAAENSGLRGFLAQQIVGRLQSLDLAPLAAGTLRSFVREGRHRSLLDDLLAAIHKFITAAHKEKSAADMKAYTNTVVGTDVSYSLVPIPAGEFVMGSSMGEKGREANEGPQHKVKISPFWMGQFEVTWNEFELFMYVDAEKRFKDQLKTDAEREKVSDAVARPTKPYVEMSFGMGKDGYPAISMTQHAANKYCQWLSAKTGHFYRLPTEAEWEYAARAGTTTAYSWGDDPKDAKQ